MLQRYTHLRAEAQANNGITKIVICNETGTRCADITDNKKFRVSNKTY